MNRVIVNAFFPGEPVTWKRAKAKGSRRFNPKFMTAAQETLRWQLKAIAPQLRPNGRARFGFQAVFQIGRRGDGDNFEKLLLDAFSGLIWEDDEQVDEGQWRKDPGAEEYGIRLIVYSIE